MTNEFGPAWHNRFQDTYITTPENIMVIYWPEVPRWCQDADTSLYMPDEEYVWVVDAEHDPERKTVWTGLFYDHVADVWMVSGEIPVYQQDRQIATIGHDIVMNELLEWALKDRLEGTYSIVLRCGWSNIYAGFVQYLVCSQDVGAFPATVGKAALTSFLSSLCC